MIKQPKYSDLCGQCCLGTILGISLNNSIKLVGHKNGTRIKELAKHFKSETNILKKGFPNNYSICKVYFEMHLCTHWVLYKESFIYDPNIGEWVDIEEWKRAFSHIKPRITSYLEIKE